MIENIPTEGLYDESYIEIMNEFEKLRSKQMKHSYKINMLGTNNMTFSILYSIFNPLRSNHIFRRYVNFVLRKILERGARKGKTLQAYTNVFWTKDQVESSTLPYPVRRTEYPWAIQQAKLDKPMKILDVGSGVSLFPVYLASKGHDVISIDNDKILMNRLSPKLAEWSGVKIKYEDGDVTNLKYSDNTFDRVFCISVLEHLEEEIEDGKIVNYHKKNLDVKAIAEMLRVLKPNGLLILTFDWDEDPHNLRSYRFNDINGRVLSQFNSNLVSDKKPLLNWEELRKKHVKAWKSYPPYNYVLDGWAIGAILKKNKQH